MPTAKPKSERPHRGGRPKISNECRRQVIELYNSDLMIKEIAARCNISEASVYRIVRVAREGTHAAD